MARVLARSRADASPRTDRGEPRRTDAVDGEQLVDAAPRTGRGDPPRERMAIECGVDGWLSKSLPVPDMSKQLRSIAEKST